MRTQAVTWIAAFALASICVGQQSEEEKRFYADFTRSEERAIRKYPDAAIPDSLMSKKAAALDESWKASNDPRFYASNKPELIFDIVAKELGISEKAGDTPTSNKTGGGMNAAEPQVPVDPQDATIPEFLGYKSVSIGKVEPDGIRIIHESGATKIPIEKLNDEQRAKYGLTMEAAAEYRKQGAANAAAHYARQHEIERSRQEISRPAAEENNPLEQWIGPGHQMAMNSYVAQFGPRFQQSGTFKEGPMKGKTLEQAIAKFEQIWATSPESVRLNWAKRAMMAGQTPDVQAAAAAAMAAEAEARRNAQSQIPEPQPMRKLAPATYTQNGNRITIDGDAGSGYVVQGDKLIEFSTGKATHVRSANTWIPLDSSHPQLRDP